MPPLVENSGKEVSVFAILRVVPMTLWQAWRASRASDLPNPEEAPVISQVKGGVGAIFEKRLVSALCVFSYMGIMDFEFSGYLSASLYNNDAEIGCGV